MLPARKVSAPQPLRLGQQHAGKTMCTSLVELIALMASDHGVKDQHMPTVSDQHTSHLQLAHHRSLIQT